MTKSGGGLLVCRFTVGGGSGWRKIASISESPAAEARCALIGGGRLEIDVSGEAPTRIPCDPQ